MLPRGRVRRLDAAAPLAGALLSSAVGGEVARRARRIVICRDLGFVARPDDRVREVVEGANAADCMLVNSSASARMSLCIVAGIPDTLLYIRTGTRTIRLCCLYSPSAPFGARFVPTRRV